MIDADFAGGLGFQIHSQIFFLLLPGAEAKLKQQLTTSESDQPGDSKSKLTNQRLE